MKIREYADPGTPVEVIGGDEFIIRLPSNPTTGYRWRLKGALDEARLVLKENEYVASEPRRIGSGGEERWKFQAGGPGRAAVSFEYARPWEKGVAPVKECTFTVEIASR